MRDTFTTTISTLSPRRLIKIMKASAVRTSVTKWTGILTSGASTDSHIRCVATRVTELSCWALHSTVGTNSKGVTIDSHESDGGVGSIHCHCCYATGISVLLRSMTFPVQIAVCCFGYENPAVLDMRTRKRNVTSPDSQSTDSTRTCYDLPSFTTTCYDLPSFPTTCLPTVSHSFTRTYRRSCLSYAPCLFTIFNLVIMHW